MAPLRAVIRRASRALTRRDALLVVLSVSAGGSGVSGVSAVSGRGSITGGVSSGGSAGGAATACAVLWSSATLNLRKSPTPFEDIAEPDGPAPLEYFGPVIVQARLKLCT